MHRNDMQGLPSEAAAAFRIPLLQIAVDLDDPKQVTAVWHPYGPESLSLGMAIAQTVVSRGSAGNVDVRSQTSHCSLVLAPLSFGI